MITLYLITLNWGFHLNPASFVCGFKLLQLRHHSLKTYFNNEQCCKRIQILQISSFLVEKVSNTGMESSLAPKKYNLVLQSSTLHSIFVLFMNLPVTSVSERCNDESPAVTQVLISIVNTGGNHSHNCPFVFKVISQLWQPLKIICIVYTILAHFCNDITSWK